MDNDSFLKSLGIIVRNQRADELVGRLKLHSDEPRGWSWFIFDSAELQAGMQVLDAGAGWGNLWRYNQERLPENITVTCVDKHNTHADTFSEYINEQNAAGNLANREFTFAWDDLETMQVTGPYDRIFFNHVVAHIRDREALYRKFAAALSDNGTFICTWGGFLFYEKMQPLLREFLKDCAELDKLYNKHKNHIEEWEQELQGIFSVEKHAYEITLSFATAEDFFEYIMQVCKPVRAVLELRRTEFLTYLEGLENLKNAEGIFEFPRDTYLYCCKIDGNKETNGSRNALY